MTANPNVQWSVAFVEELVAAGLQALYIAPGSRSTPLTLAFERHPGVKSYLHLDERCASFAALGMALATDRPVAVVCTSGTAAAEFFPAIIEARQSQVPLLVFTADRPNELRHSGANQTIDQVKLYGDQVLWSVDAALPQSDAPAVALQNLRTLAARVYACADGLVKGPVHVNFPFRKPLEPETMDEIEPHTLSAPAARIIHGAPQPTASQLDDLAEAIGRAHRGLIICGPRCPGGDFPATVAALAQRTGFPLLADPISGVRFGVHTVDTPVISTYETFLKDPPTQLEDPDLILRFGAVPTSKWLNDYTARSRTARIIHIRANGVWADDSHMVDEFWQVDEAAFCRGVTAHLADQNSRRRNGEWTAAFATAERVACETARAHCAEHQFDVAYVVAALDALPDKANIFVGNSLPIRHMDQFAAVRCSDWHVYANRGASGIDGTTSTALGIAAAEPERPLLFLTGDVAFYHDLNGLLALRRHGLRNVVIVLLNNDGGGIFRRLPVARLEPAFTQLFVTPHGLDFSHAAAMYGLAYHRCSSPTELAQRVQAAVDDHTPVLLEATTDGDADLALQRVLVAEIAKALAREDILDQATQT